MSIPSGYQVHISSYENDGDNTRTEIVSGLTKEEAQLHVFIAKSFGPCYGEDAKNSPVKGNSENELVNFLTLWKVAEKKFPIAASEYWDEPLPSEELVELLEEFNALRYNDPDKEAAKYSEVSHYRSQATRFVEFFNDFVSTMLGHPGEGYWDFKNFHRACDGIEVYLVPGEIENVTHQFIN